MNIPDPRDLPPDLQHLPRTPNEALAELARSVDRFTEYQGLSNKELAERLTNEIWGSMYANDPRSDLLAEAINRLEEMED